MARNDPLRNFRFRLEIDGLQQAGFSEVAIGATVTEAIDYREGSDAPHVRKLSGLTRYGNITLEAGVTTGGGALELYQWHAAVAAGGLRNNRKRVVIVVQTEAGEDAVRFVVNEAWPVKYDPSDLQGQGNEVFIEVLELANEGIERAQ